MKIPKKKKLIILSLISVVLLTVYVFTRYSLATIIGNIPFLIYTPPNAFLFQINYPDPSLTLYYLQTDEDNTSRLYSRQINGKNKKLLYTHNPRFQFSLLQSKKNIVVIQRDDMLLLNEDGNLIKKIYSSPKNKWIGEQSWSISGNTVLFTLYDEDYHIPTEEYALDIDAGQIRPLVGTEEVGMQFTSYSALKPRSNISAVIQEGSLVIEKKGVIIPWRYSGSIILSSCQDPKWLPEARFLVVVCNASIRIVDSETKKHAELDKGYYVQWFTNAT